MTVADARAAAGTVESRVHGRLGVAAFEYALPLAEKLERVRRLGADGCELAVPGDVHVTGAAAAAEEVVRAGVRVTAVCSLSKPNAPGAEQVGLALLEETVRCAHALAAPFAIVYFGANPERSDSDAIERYRRVTAPLVELAGELGVTILIENHFSHARGDATSTPSGCAALVGAVDSPAFALNFDPCNFAIAGVDVAAAYAELRDAVRNVHVKDARPFDPENDASYPGRIVEDLNHGRFLFVPVGDGIADNATVLEALRRDGFAGPITVEAHTPEETLDGVFARGLVYCRGRGL